jgi:hypothetical protein
MSAPPATAEVAGPAEPTAGADRRRREASDALRDTLDADNPMICRGID